MKYFLSKRILDNEELYGFSVPSSAPMDENSVKHFLYDRTGDVELHGVDCADADVAALLSIQNPRCDVREVAYGDVQEILTNCRAYLEINSEVVAEIQQQYDINREMKMIKLGNTDPQYITMLDYIDCCKSRGMDKKRAMGLRPPV